MLGLVNRLVFHHIPKSAGTTLHEELIAQFRLSEVCPERYDKLDNYTYDDLLKYNFFSGHFDKYSIDRIPSPKFVITFLRRPCDRIVSLYYYWRSYKLEMIAANNMHGPRLARELSLLDFLRTRDIFIRANIDNAYTRSFIGRSRVEDFRMLSGRDRNFFADWALCNLKRYNFVGFVEHFEEDIQRLRVLLDIDISLPNFVRNKYNEIPMEEASAREPLDEERQLSPDVEHELERLTRIDDLFYARALAARDTLQNPFPM